MCGLSLVLQTRLPPTSHRWPSTDLVTGCRLVHGESVRVLSILLLAAALFALPAGASNVDPQALVVQRADIGVGYRLDAADSGHLAERGGEQSDPTMARIAARNGRIDGYVAAYDDVRGRRVISRADVYGREKGAKNVLGFADLGMRKAGIKGLRRSRVAIASGGWIYWGGSSDAALAVVAWRHGRVFASITTSGLTRQATLTLAMKQDRRIAVVVR